MLSDDDTSWMIPSPARDQVSDYRFGICDMCDEYGPADGNNRRDWSDHDDEQLEYGANASEIAADRMASGVVRGDDLVKKKWWGESEKGQWGVYMYLRAWQNTLKARVSLCRLGIVVSYFSKSQKKLLIGVINEFDGECFTLSRKPTKEEIAKEVKRGGSPSGLTVLRKGLVFEDLWPPGAAAPIGSNTPMPSKCDGECGQAHTELEFGKSRGWGEHLRYGGIRKFCVSCLPQEAIPDEAGDTEHIGFCKAQYCGCHSCSASDFRNNARNCCSECKNTSSDGWIDRKTGDSSWFCRKCWINYYKEHRLVRLSDLEMYQPRRFPKYLSKNERSEDHPPHTFDGIWIHRNQRLSDVDPAKVDAVAKFQMSRKGGGHPPGMEDYMYFH